MPRLTEADKIRALDVPNAAVLVDGPIALDETRESDELGVTDNRPEERT
jgi:hypothetical protein